MRRFLLVAMGATTILLAGSPASRTEAMPIGSALRPAIEAINPVEDIACRRPGWHGWGWYRCGHRYARPFPFLFPGPFWAPHPFWGPRPFWGGPHPFWRWHRRH